MAAYDELGRLTAAAHGRTPSWVRGINATELWGLLMGAQSTHPASPLHVDCLSVQRGAQLGIDWANNPARKYARVWTTVASTLEEQGDRVVWMPAHCTQCQEGVKRLSNGSPLTAEHRAGNAEVDRLAKEVAKGDAPPPSQMAAVRRATERLMAIGKWVGQSGALANRFPLPEHLRTSSFKYCRDSEGLKQHTRPCPTKRKAPEQASKPPALGDLSACPWWVQLRQRVLLRASAARLAAAAE